MTIFVVSEAFVTTAAIAWRVVWIVSVLLIYVFRDRLFGPITS